MTNLAGNPDRAQTPVCRGVQRMEELFAARSPFIQTMTAPVRIDGCSYPDCPVCSMTTEPRNF